MEEREMSKTQQFLHQVLGILRYQDFKFTEYTFSDIHNIKEIKDVIRGISFFRSVHKGQVIFLKANKRWFLFVCHIDLRYVRPVRNEIGKRIVYNIACLDKFKSMRYDDYWPSLKYKIKRADLKKIDVVETAKMFLELIETVANKFDEITEKEDEITEKEKEVERLKQESTKIE